MTSKAYTAFVLGVWVVLTLLWAYNVHAAPDPSPGSHKPITWVGYSYRTPAMIGSRQIPGYWFVCHVHANGSRRCVLHHH